METTLDMLEGVEQELLARAFLFTDPVSYRDGVGATTEAVRAMLTRSPLARLGVPKPREERS